MNLKSPEHQKSWEILTEPEKLSLSLQHVMSKSTWVAGEIMNRSHYKYLEIKYRAEHFLKLFTSHFKLYDELIMPDLVRIDKFIKFFFELSISKRFKPKRILELWNNQNKQRIEKQTLNQKILTHMKMWENGNPYEVSLYNLIKEFDRWNNYRILPKVIQEPSAYKRRLKNVYKRRVKITMEIPEVSLKHIEKIFVAKRKPYLYMPLLFRKKPIILKIKDKPEIINYLTNLNFYLFQDESIAETYIEAIEVYMNKGKNRECVDGLEFWPIYREYIEKAKNYREIDNIVPSRRHLKMAMNNLEFYNQKKK